MVQGSRADHFFPLCLIVVVLFLFGRGGGVGGRGLAGGGRSASHKKEAQGSYLP